MVLAVLEIVYREDVDVKLVIEAVRSEEVYTTLHGVHREWRRSRL